MPNLLKQVEQNLMLEGVKGDVPLFDTSEAERDGPLIALYLSPLTRKPVIAEDYGILWLSNPVIGARPDIRWVLEVHKQDGIDMGGLASRLSEIYDVELFLVFPRNFEDRSDSKYWTKV